MLEAARRQGVGGFLRRAMQWPAVRLGQDTESPASHGNIVTFIFITNVGA
jgi:hypothetical protein